MSGPDAEPSVLHVIVAPPESRSGAVRAGLRLAGHLRERVDVDVVKMAGEHDDQLRSEVGTPFETIPAGTAVRDLATLVVEDEKNYTNAFVTTRLRPPEPLESYDLVHVHNPIPLAGFVGVALRCRLAGVPYCVTTHGVANVPDFPEDMEMSRPTRLAFRVGFLRPYYWVLGGARHLFALSEADAERIHARFPEQSVSVVRNGVELDPPEPDDAAAAREAFGIGPDRTVVLFVGTKIRRKGFDTLLEVAPELPASATVVAAGRSKSEELERAAAATDDVVDVGYVSKESLRLLYRRADVFVLPTRSDVLPLVVLEAMAAETPVVSTRVGGIPEQVTGETGVLVDPEDTGALREALCGLLEDERRRERMGEAAYRRVEESFSWEHVAAETARVYRSLLDGSERR